MPKVMNKKLLFMISRKTSILLSTGNNCDCFYFSYAYIHQEKMYNQKYIW